MFPQPTISSSCTFSMFSDRLHDLSCDIYRCGGVCAMCTVCVRLLYSVGIIQ